MNRRLSLLSWLPVLAWCATGCVTVYQPLVSLQRPAVINTDKNNFEGLKLRFKCIPTDYTDSGDSEVLCQNLRTLFDNQGAKVDLEVPDSDIPKPDEDEAIKPDLIVELTSRQLHTENSALQWVLFYASLTMIPAVTEATFSQDIILRDTDGFLLGQDSLQGRFVRYVGLGYWAINGLMDLIVRDKSEKLTGDNAKLDFSRDFYGQLSQLVFHARMKQLVLRNFDGPMPGTVAPAKAAAPKEDPNAPMVPLLPGFPFPPPTAPPPPRNPAKL